MTGGCNARDEMDRRTDGSAERICQGSVSWCSSWNCVLWRGISVALCGDSKPQETLFLKAKPWFIIIIGYLHKMFCLHSKSCPLDTFDGEIHVIESLHRSVSPLGSGRRFPHPPRNRSLVEEALDSQQLYERK